MSSAPILRASHLGGECARPTCRANNGRSSIAPARYANCGRRMRGRPRPRCTRRSHLRAGRDGMASPGAEQECHRTGEQIAVRPDTLIPSPQPSEKPPRPDPHGRPEYRPGRLATGEFGRPSRLGCPSSETSEPLRLTEMDTKGVHGILGQRFSVLHHRSRYLVAIVEALERRCTAIT
jgi:hypothetical protein